MKLSGVSTPTFEGIFIGFDELFDFENRQIKLRYKKWLRSSKFLNIDDIFLIWNSTHDFSKKDKTQS